MVDWQITYKCNNNCISCINPESVQGRKVLEIYSRAFFLKNESDVISIGGGEPTLHENFFEMLEEAREENSDSLLFLVTNARKFSSENFAQRLKDLELENFKIGVTIYGHNSKLHDRITRTEGSFKDTVQGIKNLLDLTFDIEVRIVVHRMNYEYLPEISKFVEREIPAISHLVFMNAKYSGRAFDNRKKLLIRYNKVVPFAQEAVDLARDSSFEVKLFHFPLCILDEKYWPYASTGLTKDTGAEEIGHVEECKGCSKKAKCSGIWKSYLDLIGRDEFKAIR